jgi:hypothetical protein
LDYKEKDIASFKESFIRLKTEFIPLREKMLQYVKENAPNFNIFSILGLERYEERTHSTFLAYLLDPFSDHGQGHLFLRTFLEYCSHRYPDFSLPSGSLSAGKWYIEREKGMRYGRMDIVLTNHVLGCLYVIENKVDALEGEYQLWRYRKWLDSMRGGFRHQELIYLTPKGRHAYYSKEVEYRQMSYRSDIASWLAESIPTIQAERVREVVQQYQELVNIM